MSDVVVVGGGIVGAACAYYAAGAGLAVTVVDRGPAGAGTTSRGEGNILVSDKAPGPELTLALWSRQLWHQIGADLGDEPLELERKGGLVVAATESAMASLTRFARDQQEAGVDTVPVPAGALHEHEPHLAPDLAGGVLYGQDLQVQPVAAAAALLTGARARGAQVRTGVEAVGLVRDARGGVTGLVTDHGTVPAGAVVNATGTWGGVLSERLGCAVPVLPRRGFILVTEPLPRVVRHKVYSADYVDNVASSDAGLETSTVVEGTKGGTVLVGASRERVGYDDAFSPEVVRRLAAQATRIFPFLARVRVIRTYHGFRPYCPDHRPVIGPDPRVPGVFHACGHEGAGIGLAPATGRLLADLLSGAEPGVDPAPYSPGRFLEVARG
ncbi:MAG TPA: FAD-binding oxidoreductase [Nocardioidaceae bacterium]|jgi:glycine/D-amino acid oxidase-like deaminating enzyme|nr:FAD-binding oxidoreductase [Nocardioidaceae bacterium]